MQDLPHNYAVAATAATDSNVSLSSPGIPDLDSAAPAEFGGPGDLWSPETLLVASVADCFILSFRSIARASSLEWSTLRCEVDGILDRVDKVTKFVAFNVRAILAVPDGTDEAKAMRLLERADKVCLITNSLIAESRLEAEVRTSAPAAGV